MNKYFYILLFIITTSCGISEDCFKGNGSPTKLNFQYDNFTKVKVYSGVGLVVKEGPEYEVRIETRDNIKDNIEVVLNGDMLVIKDNSSCNIARDYGVTTVYITAPDLQEIHNKTEQSIRSDGVLHYRLLRLFALEDGDGSASGDYYIDLESSGQLVVESNTVTNFYINGTVGELLLNFYFGDGRFNGKDFEANIIKVYHRGSNDMIVNPTQRIEGKILSVGNVILKNVPSEIEVEEFFTGQLIYD